MQKGPVVTIYDSPLLQNVVAEFETFDQFERSKYYNQSHPDFECPDADCVAVGGFIIMGWDEYDEWKQEVIDG